MAKLDKWIESALQRGSDALHWLLHIIADILTAIWDFIAQLDYGNVPDWIAAIGTVAAFGVALFIYGRDLELRRKAQAWLVFAKVSDTEILDPKTVVPNRFTKDANALMAYCDPDNLLLDYSYSTKKFTATTSIRITKITISNGSSTAIPYLTGELIVGGKPLPNTSFGPIHTLGPTSEQNVVVVFTRHTGSLILISSPRISFQDGTGFWWTRHATLAPKPEAQDDKSGRGARSILALPWRTLKDLVASAARSLSGRA